MSKFLRTVQKIDGINQKVILQVEKCNDCPLMKFHQQSCLATCRVFSSDQGNVVDDFVLDYNVNTGEIYGDIEIPEWCRLADFKNQLNFDIKTYTTHNDKVLTSDAIVDDDLPVYMASDIDKKHIVEEQDDLNSMLPALVAASVFKNDSDAAYEAAYAEYDEYDEYGYTHYTSNITTKNDNNCSLCGEEDKSVNRNTNHGMCDQCWEVSYDNDDRKKQAFINNFRMKRGEAFKMEMFNLSVLKTDKSKVLISVK
jgi:hypothetical protein